MVTLQRSRLVCNTAHRLAARVDRQHVGRTLTPNSLAGSDTFWC
jgi:hypothetical protein